VLGPPSRLLARPGRGQVTLDWDPVPGAAGYLVHRGSAPDGPFRPIDHGGGDVLAVPEGPYCDVGLRPGETAWYAVAAVTGPGAAGPLSLPVQAGPDPAGSGRVDVRVGAEVTGGMARPWQPVIGSEHLSMLLRTDTIGGQVIGADLREALRIAHDELGVEAVRAHGILDDDLGVYSVDQDGAAVHDFTGVDAVYDVLTGLGLRPVVELSYMPAALAADPGRTVFVYRAGISPPSDWDRWAGLIRDLAGHLIDRYGRVEVVGRWSFEVWNEPNLEVFWSGTPQEYFRLYEVTARAIRSVDKDLRVGGPASAAAGWTGEFLAHLAASGAPADFLSTHTYGNAPLDLRPELDRHGRAGLPVWWTEWGATPTHFNRVGDGAFAAAFLLRGVRATAGRADVLAHWVASDNFEELGAPAELFHGGFGLLTVGHLRKPRFWALTMLARLGASRLAVEVSGDGAGSLVQALAATGEDGRIGALIWNAPLNQAKRDGDPLLDREVRLSVEAPAGAWYTVTQHRIDAGHSNIVATWERMRGAAAWPDERQWDLLRAANRLEEGEPPTVLRAGRDGLELDLALPMPGVVYMEFVHA
jgi:xylan 1,4-beta-xylosidase